MRPDIKKTVSIQKKKSISKENSNTCSKQRRIHLSQAAHYSPLRLNLLKLQRS